MKRVLVLLGILMLLLPGVSRADVQREGPFRVLRVEVEGTINPAQRDLLKEALTKAGEKRADALLIRLNTPGGLGQSMREMTQTILNADVPVLVWVGPAGARAASAGVFIVAASHAAGMSATATIGAASPVNVSGGDVDKTMAKKVQNDMLSLVRGVSKERGRNAKWYESAVTDAVSISGVEAQKQRVVEYVSPTEEEFLQDVGEKGIAFEGGTIRFDPKQVEILEYKASLRHALLSWLLDPQVAYLLLLAGIAGIFFEMTTPGAIFPGVFGGICLVLALYALSILPTNVAGVALILLALVLFILEIFVTSFGLLTVAALVSIFFGSTILFQQEFGFQGLGYGTILPTVIGVGVLAFCGVYLVARSQIRRPKQGENSLLGRRGTVRRFEGEYGQAFIYGELWKVRSEDGTKLEVGEKIEVVQVDGLTLTVKRTEDESEEESERKGE